MHENGLQWLQIVFIQRQTLMECRGTVGISCYGSLPPSLTGVEQSSTHLLNISGRKQNYLGKSSLSKCFTTLSVHDLVYKLNK